MTESPWINVEGEIIGWLVRDGDGTEIDCDLAVVKVIRWKHESHQIWQTPRSELPVCVLRWLGNDCHVIKHSTVSRETEEEINLGDHLAFSTSFDEQDGYALWS